MMFIYYLSDQPPLEIEPWFYAQDKVFHGVMFGVLGALLLVSMRQPAKTYTLSQTWTAIGIAALYGVFDEIHQSFVPGRTPDPMDVLADTFGALLVVSIVRWRVRSRPMSQ